MENEIKQGTLVEVTAGPLVGKQGYINSMGINNCVEVAFNAVNKIWINCDLLKNVEV